MEGGGERECKHMIKKMDDDSDGREEGMCSRGTGEKRGWLGRDRAGLGRVIIFL